MGQTLSENFRLQRCEPGVAYGAVVTEPAFGTRKRLPVSAEFDADGEAITIGIAFDDYVKMHTIQRKTSGERRLPTPSWAVNYTQQRELIARYMELRAGMHNPRIDTPAKRLRYAYRKYMRDKLPGLIKTVDGLLREAATCLDPERKRKLEIQIRSIDGQLRVARQGPGVFVAIIHHYYGAGCDSVATASELAITPWSVRQLLWRFHRLWKAMQDGTDKKPTPEEVRRAHDHAVHKKWLEANPEKVATQRTQVKAYRDANREFFRAQQRAWHHKNRECRLAERQKRKTA